MSFNTVDCGGKVVLKKEFIPCLFLIGAVPLRLLGDGLPFFKVTPCLKRLKFADGNNGKSADRVRGMSANTPVFLFRSAIPVGGLHGTVHLVTHEGNDTPSKSHTKSKSTKNIILTGGYF